LTGHGPQTQAGAAMRTACTKVISILTAQLNLRRGKNMDFQAMIDSMNESTAKDRANYHLTYGQLIQVLKAAPPDAVFDERINGIGSWRGSYIEVALFTEEHGLYATNGEFTGDYANGAYQAWVKENSITVEELPKNANELGALLESLLGKDFIGYKGGNFTIEEYKPLWLEAHDNDCDSVAIIGIDENLKLITKQIRE
jgi:hypothetical protein